MKFFEYIAWLIVLVGLIILDNVTNIKIIENNFQSIIISLLCLLIIQFITIKISFSNNKNELINTKEDILSSFKHSFGGSFRTFDNSDDLNSYYSTKLKKTKQIEDFTWAPFSHPGNSNKIHKTLESIFAYKSQVDYCEIFVFNEGNTFRQDRLKKLEFHYLKAKKGKNSKYSCAYFEGIEFPRIQFTIIDEKEILFSSAESNRCSIENKTLANIFSKYWEDSWQKATKLIENGIIIDEKKIKELISKIK